MIAMQTSERNGAMIGAMQVFPGDELMLISNLGTLVRTAADQVSELGRNTQGVKLINLRAGELLNSIGRIAEEDITEQNTAEQTAEDDPPSGDEPDS